MDTRPDGSIFEYFDLNNISWYISFLKSLLREPSSLIALTLIVFILLLAVLIICLRILTVCSTKRRKKPRQMISLKPGYFRVQYSDYSSPISNRASKNGDDSESMQLMDPRKIKTSKMSRSTKIWGSRIFIIVINGSFIIFCTLLLISSAQMEARILASIETLPSISEKILFQASETVIELIRESLNVFEDVSISDTSKPNSQSHLRSFISNMEVLLSKVVAIGLNITDNPIATADIFVESVNRLLYKYLRLTEIENKDLSFLKQENAMYSISEFKTFVKVYLIMNKTSLFESWENIICQRAVYTDLPENLKLFKDCKYVKEFFKNMNASLNNLIEDQSSLLPRRDLRRALRSQELPKLFNVEQHVQYWLPIIQDPANSIKSILQTYAEPQIKSLHRDLRKLFMSFLSRKSKEKFIYILDKIKLGIKILLGMAGFTLACEFYLLILYIVSKVHNRRRKKLGDSCFRKNKRNFTIIYSLYIITIFVFTFITFAVMIASDLAVTKGCDYLFIGQKQRKADDLIMKQLYKASPNIPILKDLMQIKNLDLQYPRYLLDTLNTDYAKNKIPLLRKLGMERPINITVLLKSDWLISCLQKIWNKEVKPILDKTNLTSLIPNVNLMEYESLATKVLGPAFDDLNVYPVDQYFINPGEDFFNPLLKVLKSLEICDENCHNLQQTAVAYDKYKIQYHEIEHALDGIVHNKNILKDVITILNTSNLILKQLRQLDQEMLVKKVSRIANNVVNKSSEILNNNVTPFINEILYNAIPYPTLSALYHFTLSPVCQIPIELQSNNKFIDAFTLNNPILRAVSNFSWTLTRIYLCIFIVAIFVATADFIREKN